MCFLEADLAALQGGDIKEAVLKAELVSVRKVGRTSVKYNKFLTLLAVQYGHFPTKGKRKKCRACQLQRHQKETQLMCKGCGEVPICVECFGRWHCRLLKRANPGLAVQVIGESTSNERYEESTFNEVYGEESTVDESNDVKPILDENIGEDATWNDDGNDGEAAWNEGNVEESTWIESVVEEPALDEGNDA